MKLVEAHVGAHKKDRLICIVQTSLSCFLPDAFTSDHLPRLKDVEDEVVTAVVRLLAWVEVVPVLVVYRDSH